MLPLRKEIDDYSRSCEHLIGAASLADAIPFTAEEIEWIAYYGSEMTGLANQLLHNSRPHFEHKRLTIREFAAACEALLHMDGFSESERDSIRRSVSNVATKILGDKEAPPLKPACDGNGLVKS